MDMTRRPFLSVIALVFIVGGLFLFVIYERTQRLASDAFIAARINISQNSLEGERQYVKTAYADVIVDCTSTDRSKYYTFVNMDSRTMTEQELRDALKLHAACGMYAVDTDKLALDFLRRDTENIRTLTSLFSDPSLRTKAEMIAQAWADMYDLDKEKNDIDARLVDIQQGYWEAELDKVRGIDTPTERETRVGTLNVEAREKLAREQEIVAALQTLRQKESELFSGAFPDATAEAAAQTK